MQHIEAFIVAAILVALWIFLRQKSGLKRVLTKGGQPVVELWVGPPGNGKSLYAATRIEEFLLYDRRAIVTSLAVRLVGWDTYMAKRHNFQAVKDRLFVLEDWERRSFWENRGRSRSEFRETVGGGSLGFVVDEKGKSVAEKKKMEATGEPYVNWKFHPRPRDGVIYILDEVHNDFRARETGKTPAALLEYLSQARQYGDRVIAITQHPKNLDVCFTRLADRFCTFTNTGKQRLWGLGFPRSFLRQDYTSVKMDRNSFVGFSLAGFNGQIAELYDTGAAGVGSADKDEKSARVFSVPVIFGVVFLVVAVGVLVLPRAILDAVFKRKAAVTAVSRPPVTRVNPPVRAPRPVESVKAELVHQSVQSLMSSDGTNWVVVLSDQTRFRVVGVETLNGVRMEGGLVVPYPGGVLGFDVPRGLGRQAGSRDLGLLSQTFGVSK